ncbi:MAG: cache domain-containing protein, partial [Sulfurospirillaceae bacterium]|nr:cache domain-containing protein [Sulfurospirillaceae bacterium]
MKKTLVNYYLLLTLFFTIAVILVVTSVYIKTQQDIFIRNTQDLKESVLENYKAELKNRVEIIEQYIDYKKSTTEQRLRDAISLKVNEAYKIAQSIYLNNKATMSEENIKKLIVETLRHVRFNEGRGYYFIDTLDGDCVLFPTNPTEEGKNILHYQDTNQKYVINDFIQIVQNQQEGFSEYFTYQPQKDKGRYKKIAFVKFFETFNWIIGTGEYLDNVEDDIKQELALELSQYRIDQNTSYFSVFEVHNFQGGDDFASLLVNPNLKNKSDAKKISTNVKDIDGFHYRQDALNKIIQNGDGFVFHKLKKINSDAIGSELSYFKLMKHWNWVISTSKELDSLELIVGEREQKIQEKVSENIRYASLLFIIVFVLLLIFSVFISKKIKHDMGVMTHFLKLASFDKTEIDTQRFKIEEFKQLSIYANAMIKEIKSQHQDLSEINENLEYKVYTKTKELQSLNFSLETKNKELEKNYFTDTLTKLPNRNMFTKDLTFISFPQVFLLDIDGFKNINDFYGTVVGDIVLVEFSDFIGDIGEQYDLKVYRLSSDEFIMQCDRIFEPSFLQMMLQDMNTKLAKKYFNTNEKDFQLQINVTCGVAFGKNNLLEKADIALNFAKKKKLAYAIFNEDDPIMNTHKNNIYWRQKLQNAIQNDAIVPYYQEIININDRETKKYECLMRLVEEDKVISPYLFLEVAKETKLYHKLTRIMIQKSFQEFADKEASFSLNISLLDIENSTTREFLKDKINEFNIGHRLILELLESEEIITSEKFLPFVEEMRSLGVRFALDDFGSGYSNFSFVLQMHPYFVKIDGSLIKNIITDKNSYIVVQAIVAFAK